MPPVTATLNPGCLPAGGWAGEKLVLHKLRFHPDFVAPFSPALSLSVLSHLSREARRIVFVFQGSRITPPSPPSQGGKRIAGGKGSVTRVFRRSARNKNTRLETVPPVRSTSTFHHPTLRLAHRYALMSYRAVCWVLRSQCS